MALKSLRKRLVYAFTAPAGPERIFPLLCPVREYDWIPHWKCRLLYSESGVAEKDCVFRTCFKHRGRELWTCYLYEPAERIGYLRKGAGRVVRLEISLVPGGDETKMSWETTFTGLNWRGNRFIEKMTQEAYDNEAGALAAMLCRYLETGASMPAKEARALLGS